MGTIEVRCGWPHDGRHREMVDELYARLDNGGADRILYLVPTADMARTVRTEALDGTSRRAVTHVPVLTFNDLVAQLLGSVPHDPARPYRIISAAEKLLLVEQVFGEYVDAASASGASRSLSADPDTLPSVVRRLAQLIGELKRNLCPGGDELLDSLAHARSTQPMSRDVAAVYDLYQRHLQDNDLVDSDGTFFLVYKAFEDDTSLLHESFPSLSTLMVEGFRDFTSVERSILGQVAHAVERSVLAVDYVPAAEELFAATKDTYTFYCALAGSEHGLHETSAAAVTETQRLWTDVLLAAAGAQTAEPVHDGIELTVYPDPRAEIAHIAEAVKGLLVEHGYNNCPDKIAVITPRPDPWHDAVEELFPRYGIPLTVTRQKPLGGSGPIRAVMDMLRVRAGSFDRTDLLALLDNPYIADRPDPAVLDRHATALHITGGSTAAWLEPLRARAIHIRAGRRAEDDTDARNLDRLEADRLEEACDSLSRLLGALELVPLRAAGDEYRAAVMRLLDEPPTAVAIAAVCADLVRSRPDVVAADARAIKKFRDLIGELCSALDRYGGSRLELSELIDVIRVALSETSYSAGAARSAGVVLGRFGDVSPRRYDHVFLPGLTDDVLPERMPRRVFFRESDRRQSVYMQTVGSSVRRGWLDFVSATLSACQTVHLSRPATGWDDKPTVPSIYIDEITDSICQERAERMYTDATLQGHLGRQLAAVVNGAIDSLALLDMAHELRRREYPPMRTMVQAARAECLRRREEACGTLGAYDGRIGDSRLLDALRDRFGAGRHVFSVNQLESYAACPFTFFCDRVLRLDQPEEFREDVEAKDRGIVVHEILRRFFERWQIEAGRAAILQEDLDAACRCLRKEADAVLASSPVADYGGVFWDAVCIESTRGLDIEGERFGVLRALLDTEIGADRQPDDRYLEWRFGHAVRDSGSADRRSVESELRLPTERRTAAGTTVPDAGAGPVRIAGKIDRIDVFDSGGGHEYALLDYKTSASNPSGKDVLSGASYQLGMYAVAVEEMLFDPTDRLEAVGFYRIARPDDVEMGTVREKTDTDYETMMDAVVRNVIDDVNGMLHGYFHAAGDTAACRYCECRRICRSDPRRIDAIDDPIVRRKELSRNAV